MAGAGNERTCCGCVCAFLVSAGVIVLIYWGTFQPRHIEATVDSATLSNLTVRQNATAASSAGGAAGDAVVSYRLAVNLTLYNPSVRVGVRYDALDAWLRFRPRDDDGDGSANLGLANRTSPAVFYQPRRSGGVVTIEFDGTRGVTVDGGVAAKLDREVKEEKEPAAGLELAIDARVRYKLGFFMVRARPAVRCPLRIPVKAERRRGGGVGGVLSPGDRCSVKY